MTLPLYTTPNLPQPQRPPGRRSDLLPDVGGRHPPRGAGDRRAREEVLGARAGLILWTHRQVSFVQFGHIYEYSVLKLALYFRDVVAPLVSPPLPAALVDSFFSALDENQDGHVDFKELSCGVSAACRGPEMERQKCECIVDCARLFLINKCLSTFHSL